MIEILIGAIVGAGTLYFAWRQTRISQKSLEQNEKQAAEGDYILDKAGPDSHMEFKEILL